MNDINKIVSVETLFNIAVLALVAWIMALCVLS